VPPRTYDHSPNEGRGSSRKSAGLEPPGLSRTRRTRARTRDRSEPRTAAVRTRDEFDAEQHPCQRRLVSREAGCSERRRQGAAPNGGPNPRQSSIEIRAQSPLLEDRILAVWKAPIPDVISAGIRRRVRWEGGL
jgi:hypothetical protein